MSGRRSCAQSCKAMKTCPDPTRQLLPDIIWVSGHARLHSTRHLLEIRE